MRDSVTDLGRYPGLHRELKADRNPPRGGPGARAPGKYPGLHREPKADRNRPRGGPGARAPGKYPGPSRRRPKAVEHG